MKSLFETVEMILLILLVLGLVFLFTGEPDLWDKLHAAAMAALTDKPAAE